MTTNSLLIQSSEKATSVPTSEDDRDVTNWISYDIEAIRTNIKVEFREVPGGRHLDVSVGEASASDQLRLEQLANVSIP